ncbi:MAG TPA: HAMP domain-containing sensor histidine kinase [Kofleriaceae bacterium]|nr:HAMP domain-containing sensor histidine kinase [Kofleriaceae bacterium]
MSRDEEELERAKEHLRSLQMSLPELIEYLRKLAEIYSRPDIARALPNAQQEAERIAGLLAYIERYTRVDAQTFGPVDLRAVLEEAVALTRAEIEQRGRVSVAYLEAPLVRGNPRQLGHVFIALLINAAQSLAEGAPHANYVAVELDTNPDGGWARIAIADSGSGIYPEDVAHIFEPLYTTKRGAGMGIGLAAVREIITGLGGRISVESVPGSGSLFIVELPPAS